MRLKASYYAQFDADYSREVPAEGFTGWCTRELEFSDTQTGLAVMHAWDVGTYEDCPALFRHVEYIPRAYRIVREVFPPVLAAARRAGVPIIHIVGYGDYYQHLEGYKRCVELAGPAPTAREHISRTVKADAQTLALREFRGAHVAPGLENGRQMQANKRKVDFPAEARPVAGELIAESAHQALGACKHHGLTHLIYMGFAINWCLLMEQAGMIDMSRRGIMCSAVRDGVTAVESGESARHELNKKEALWRVGMRYGFVFESADLVDGWRDFKRPGGGA